MPPMPSSPRRRATLTGRFLIDDIFLAERGVTDFDRYRVDPTQKLVQDFFVPDDMPPPQAVDPQSIDTQLVAALTAANGARS